MIKVILFFIFSISIFPSFSQNKTEKYIAKYSSIAIIEMDRYNIPASITLAQGILESGSGESRLATQGNNHFGIKCHDNWHGETIIEDDDKKGECFRKYLSVANSYRDHSLFLTKRGRYSFLFEYKSGDYIRWARGLKEAGYATNPKYASLLINLIEKYNLDRFDRDTSKQKKIFFSHSYGLPYLTGLGVYYIPEGYIYSIEVNTSFVFSEVNIGYNYEFLNKLYIGSNVGWIFIPVQENILTPQIAGELIYNAKSILIRGGVQIPIEKNWIGFDALNNYKIIPFFKLIYLIN